LLSFGVEGDEEESDHEDDKHDTKESEDNDEDEDGNAEEHVDVVDTGVDHAILFLLILGLPVAVDDSVTE